ncbi:MAG: SDR family NAD(P)-dependent oxidoreductase, partial [Gemmataceae bacterium]
MALPEEERRSFLQELLVNLVGDRTGYPLEMLDLDHSMEADLGIDSIKRTEIFGSLRDRLGFHGEAYEKEEYYIKLGKLRTLREVLSWLVEETVPKSQRSIASPSASTASEESRPHELSIQRLVENGAAEAIRFGVVSKILSPPVMAPTRSVDNDVLLVVDGPSGKGQSLLTMLRGKGWNLAFVRHSDHSEVIQAGSYRTNLLSSDGVRQLYEWIEKDIGKVTSLCHLVGLEDIQTESSPRFLELKSLYQVTAAFGMDILKARGSVLAVTNMGGSFGLDSPNMPFNPGQAGMPGFLKSLAREWPEVRIKCVDIYPEMDNNHLLARIGAELESEDRIIEIGYGPSERSTLEVVQKVISSDSPQQIEINEESVVLLLGGGRGITAGIAHEMAQRFRCRLILAGRSPLPEKESEETSELTSPADIKRALADSRKRKGGVVTPSAIEQEYRALQSARELRSNLSRLDAIGATYTYHSIDVRNEEQLTHFLRTIYQTHGKLDGVVHAAGLIGDSLLIGKTADVFDKIFETKVNPALVLEKELHPESLKFLVFFSSVAARFGNVGQTDYAAANEVLNKLARKLDRDWIGRVVSIGWGPWDEVGMARPDKMSPEYLAAVGFAHMPLSE